MIATVAMVNRKRERADGLSILVNCHKTTSLDYLSNCGDKLGRLLIEQYSPLSQLSRALGAKE